MLPLDPVTAFRHTANISLILLQPILTRCQTESCLFIAALLSQYIPAIEAESSGEI